MGSPTVRVAIHGGYMGYCILSVEHMVLSKCDTAHPLTCRWFRLIALKILGGYCRAVAASGRKPIPELCLRSNRPTDKVVLQHDLFRFECILEHSWATSGKS